MFMRTIAGMLTIVFLTSIDRPCHGYITAPVTTLGQLCNSTHVTVVQVDKVNKAKGVIIYRKVKDLKGKYPKDTIKHVFDLKNTPAHKGPGDVPVRPDETDWKYALDWAAPGKTAVMFTLKYDPYGDFGHTYIDGCWYATMCPPRDWEFWYSIYSDPACLKRWHAGTPAHLITAVEIVLSGKQGVTQVLVDGNKTYLRSGKAKLQGLKVSVHIGDYNPTRDLVREPNVDSVRSLTTALRSPDKAVRMQAARDLADMGPAAKAAVQALAEVVRNDSSGTVRLLTADALGKLGPAAKAARPALQAALQDPRLAQRPEVLAKIREVLDKLK